MKRLSILASLMAAFSLIFSGCGGVSPSPAFYLLDSPGLEKAEARLPGNFSIGIGPVILPAHLDRAEIVTRNGDNGVSIMEFHRWAAPLDRQVSEILVTNLSALLGIPRVTAFPWDRARRPELRVDISIFTFDKMGDRAVMDAVWEIRNIKKDKILITRGFDSAVNVPPGDVAAYVAAQAGAMDALSRDIAKGIVELAVPGQP